MDFHALPRRDLQALCKRNGIRANMTNVAMADALSALPAVNGIEEYVKPPVDEPAPAAKPVVKAVAEEDNQGIQSREIIILDDSEEEGKEKDLRRDEDEENALAPALGLVRCGASRRARVDPAVAPAPRRRAAAGKKKTVDAVAPQDVPARTTRPRSQRMAAKMAVAWNTGVIADGQTVVPAPVSPDERGEPEEAMNQHTEQQTELVEVQGQEDEGNKGVISEVKTTVPEPISSDERASGAEEMQETTDPQKELQNELVEEQRQEDEGDTGAVMDIPEPVEEEPPVAEDCKVDSSAEEREMDVQHSDDSPVVLGFVEQERSDTFLNDNVPRQGPLEGEIHHSTEETEVVPVSEAPPATMESGAATEEFDFTDDAGCVVVEKKEVASFGEVVQSPAEANEASTEEGLLAEQKEDPVDAVVPAEEEGVVATNETPEIESVANEDSTEEGLLAEQKEDPVDDVVPAEEEGVVATNEAPERSVAMDEIVEEVATVENVSQVTVTDNEGEGKERDFAVDLPPVVDTAKDADTISSPLFVGMIDDATKSLPMDSITVETVQNNSGGEKSNTEPVAVEQEKDVNKSEALGNLSLRKLRVKLKEIVAANSIIVEPMVSIDSITVDPTHDNSGGEKNVTEPVAVEQEKEVNDISKSEALGNLSLRKLRVQLKEMVAVDSISVEPTVVRDFITVEATVSEPVAVEHENEVKQDSKSEASGNLSQKKLGVNLKEKVAIGQENEAKEVNKSMALDKLSLRKLRLKLKETLNAHKSREPNRVALGRLDENAC